MIGRLNCLYGFGGLEAGFWRDGRRAEMSDWLNGNFGFVKFG